MPIKVYLGAHVATPFEIEGFEGICPYCAKEGLKSRLTLGRTESTAMGFAPFYDEDGKYHSHNPNTVTSRFSCSNGHRFIFDRKRPCHCGWGAGEGTITLRT